MRYWLSVGATPTRGAQRLLEAYGFVPKAPRPFGRKHAYSKPEKPPLKKFYTPFNVRRVNTNRVVLHYRQKLHEEMNIIERKRRLAQETLSVGGTNLEAASIADELDGEDTDGMESDEADIFERKRKFEKLLKRFEKHREENAMTLRGNDLRYNVYLKKLNKYARKDLGLDILGYKDYVNNLKEFASVNDEMGIFAIDNFNADKQFANDDNLLVTSRAAYADGSTGLARVKRHKDKILFTIAKMLRTGYVAYNSDDTAAIEELKKNFGLYMQGDIVLIDYLRLLNKRYKRDVVEREERDKLIASFMEAPQRGTKVVWCEQERLQLDQDARIFLSEGKIHSRAKIKVRLRLIC